MTRDDFQDWKRELREFFKHHKMPDYRLTFNSRGGFIVIHGWPCPQGLGVEAAALMERRWAKIDAFAAAHGFAVGRRRQ
jgi:hypothetical protein